MTQNHLTALNKIIKDFYSNEICMMLDMVEDPSDAENDLAYKRVFGYLDASLVNFEMLDLQDEYYRKIIKTMQINELYRPYNINLLKDEILTLNGYIELFCLHRTLLSIKILLEMNF